MNRADIGLLDEKLEREKRYWLEKLSGNLVLTGVPPDFNRPDGPSGEKASLDVDIDPETASRLIQVCRSSEELLFTVLIATLKICLHKYSAVEDIIVGTAIHERYKEIASLNRVLALRDTVRRTMTAKQLLLEVKRTLADAYTHQKYPFDNLLGILGFDPKNSRQRLFNVAIILENINNRANLSSLTNDLTLAFALRDGAVTGAIEYDLRLFKPETIEVFREHYRIVLRAILTDPDIEISKIDLLSDEKRRRFLFEFNSSEADYPREQTISRLFERQVERAPESVAVEYLDQQLTYRDLNSKANQLARHLQRHNIGPGRRAGIYLEHSFETLIALLGVLKAGAAYVPFDPEHPQSRLEFMLKDADIPVILTQERLVDRLPDDDATVICLDSQWDTIAQESSENLQCAARGEDLAYLIYTSGSTGEPKGVKVQNAALVNYVWWAKQVYLRDSKLACALFTPLAFDLTVTMIYMPLITGNKIVVYRQNGKEIALTRVLEDKKADILKLTPSHLALIKDRDNRGCRLKRLIVGGEAFENGLARKVLDSFGGGVEIFNEYGPTEATVGCMIHRYDPVCDDRALMPIGRPAANAQIYVLDEMLNPVAENVIGELYISGEGLAQGYLNRSELTEKKFISNPFSPGKRMYKTGDLARWLPEGILEYVGRNDDQVKFHGYRVELNEIRSALNQHPQVRESAVTVARDQNGFDVMLAYYVSDRELEAEELRSFLSARIIEETIPNIFVRVEKIPLTLNGKADYRALPSLDEARQRARQSYVAPRTPTETIVAGIWKDVLGLTDVGIYDNFFSLGGHSLMATQVISRMQAAFHMDIPMRLVFDNPSIADVALAVTEMQIEQETDDEIARILEEVTQLTEAELEGALAQEIHAAANMEAK
ncbi:MAG TPA: amino acid adenylation domain-containing protein [Blastocatellia bacterium]|nr:amino acid adenylation domain-containing protein [Blastocatellia bacterium]